MSRKIDIFSIDQKWMGQIDSAQIPISPLPSGVSGSQGGNVLGDIGAMVLIGVMMAGIGIVDGLFNRLDENREVVNPVVRVMLLTAAIVVPLCLLLIALQEKAIYGG